MPLMWKRITRSLDASHEWHSLYIYIEYIASMHTYGESSVDCQ